MIKSPLHKLSPKNGLDDPSCYVSRLVGEDGELSILVPQWVGEMDNPVYELCDGTRQTTYWVGEIPTPRQAAMLLEEHGGPPEEERGNPYKRTGDEEG